MNGSVEIEEYKQKNGNEVLKVILKPTKKFPEEKTISIPQQKLLI